MPVHCGDERARKTAITDVARDGAAMGSLGYTGCGIASGGLTGAMTACLTRG